MLDLFLEELKTILRNRQKEYGTPEKSHRSIATLWSWYIHEQTGKKVSLQPLDVAAMMMLLKMVRVASPSRDECINDTAIDLAGYASIIYQLKPNQSPDNEDGPCVEDKDAGHFEVDY